MKINGKRFADSCIDYGHPVNFAILFCRGVMVQEFRLKSVRYAEGALI